MTELANIHAPSSAVLTINEVYTLIDALSVDRGHLSTAIDRLSTTWPALCATLQTAVTDLNARIWELQQIVDADKRAQLE